MTVAKKLPSGNWRVNQYLYTDEAGKKHYKSFTAPTRKEAEYRAHAFLVDFRPIEKNVYDITLGDAITLMLERKKPILSPATYRNYTQLSNGTYYDQLRRTNVRAITDTMVQRMINAWVESGLSPKTIRNLYGFFVEVVHGVDERITYKIQLPRQYTPDVYIPTDDDVKTLLAIQQAVDPTMALATMLAGYLGLRRSEIVALTWDKVDLEANTITIDQATVLGANNEKITKKPKSSAGKRTVDMPKVLSDALRSAKRGKDERVVPLTGDQIYNRHARCLKRNGMKHYRFHDLRHYYASVMLSLGVPDKYAMERMGHATNSVLKNVYQHTMEDKQREISAALNDRFAE